VSVVGGSSAADLAYQTVGNQNQGARPLRACSDAACPAFSAGGGCKATKDNPLVAAVR
jgi:hypothetical protein